TSPPSLRSTSWRGGASEGNNARTGMGSYEGRWVRRILWGPMVISSPSSRTTMGRVRGWPETMVSVPSSWRRTKWSPWSQMRACSGWIGRGSTERTEDTEVGWIGPGPTEGTGDTEIGWIGSESTEGTEG